MWIALRKFGIAAATALAVLGTTAAVPGIAEARGGFGGHFGGGHWGGGHFGGGHWGGGHWGGWRGHGGWGRRGYAWGALGTGLAFGLAAPYYGGYYGGYYGPYAYDYGYGSYAYADDCYIRRHWVINRYGHRVLRRVTVCY